MVNFFQFVKYIGECLIGTLTDGLKEDFTPKTKKAWAKMFGVVESHMKVGMRQAESEKSAKKAAASEAADATDNSHNNSNTNGSVNPGQSDETSPSNGHIEDNT